MKKITSKNRYLTKSYFEKELIKRLNQYTKEIIDYVDIRFEEVDKRFEQVDKRFEQVDKRFEQVDKRFEQVEKRLDEMDIKLNKLLNHLDWLVGEYKKFDEEHIVLTEQTRRMKDQIENHEKRISSLENITSSN